MMATIPVTKQKAAALSSPAKEMYWSIVPVAVITVHAPAMMAAARALKSIVIVIIRGVMINVTR